VKNEQAMHDLSQATPTRKRSKKSPAIAKDDRPRIYESVKKRKTARARGRRNALPGRSGETPRDNKAATPKRDRPDAGCTG
jgi:hypothetical protein